MVLFRRCERVSTRKKRRRKRERKTRDEPPDGRGSGGRDGPGATGGGLLARLAVPDTDSSALDGVLSGGEKERGQLRRRFIVVPSLHSLCLQRVITRLPLHHAAPCGPTDPSTSHRCSPAQHSALARPLSFRSDCSPPQPHRGEGECRRTLPQKVQLYAVELESV